MAVRVIARVWDGFPGGGSELLALLALADWSDDDGRCWPSMASIARKIRLSPDQARRVVHKLIDGNFVRVTAGNGGGRISRRYQINLDALSPGSDATPGVDVRADVTASPPLASLSGLALQSCASRTVMDTSRDPQETQKPSDEGSAPPGSTSDNCPHQAIISLYHELLPMARRVREWTPERQRALRARWRERAERQSLDWWSRLFKYVAQSDFLCGRVSSPGRKPFELSLDWLLKSNNFVKVIEGAYETVRQEIPT